MKNWIEPDIREVSIQDTNHGNGHGKEFGWGHGYDNGPGMGPGNGNGYGHNKEKKNDCFSNNGWDFEDDFS